MGSSVISVPNYVSHKTDERHKALRDHLNEVAQMASDFARPFGAEGWAALAGIAHDIGKYSKEFQDRILRGGRRVDHSTAGALELSAIMLPHLAFCIAGHHGGLPNGGDSVSIESDTLFARLKRGKRGDIPDYSAYRTEIDLKSRSKNAALPSVPTLLPSSNDKASRDSVKFSHQFFIRMLFSCLVDADYQCTERFMAGRRARLDFASIETLRDQLEARLAKFYPPKGSVNEQRCSVLDACLEAASWKPGVFSLTVPTGGGKTLASLRFALNHIAKNSETMRRVIYAIPYTSIIDQNARVFRDILGMENVLEHHTNFDFGDQGEPGETLRLAAENWEAPVVVTTNVQLFESLFANKPSRCRKLHNIAGSVIVLDEAQMIPTEQLLPCTRALTELVLGYRCSIVLCTATQPSLDKFFRNYECLVREIIPDASSLFETLERVEYFNAGILSNEELARRLGDQQQALCVVNSRRQARELYGLLRERGDAFHLTTSMYPVHRERVLAEIRKRMDGDATRPCRVIATSLVEAGVDLDFPVVYRALAGIDSVVQAAGRCNREGRMSKGTVFIFQPEERYRIPRDIDQKRAISESLLSSERIGSPTLTEAYFKRLHTFRCNELDAKDVLSMLSTYRDAKDRSINLCLPSIPFEDAARAFSVIDDATYTVVVACDANKEDVRALEEGRATRSTLRRLARYSVGVYETDYKQLIETGALDFVHGDVCVLMDRSLYSDEIGLDPKAATEGRGLFL